MVALAGGTDPSVPPAPSRPSLQPQRRDQDGNEEQHPELPVPAASRLGIRESLLVRHHVRGQLGLVGKRDGRGFFREKMF